MLSSQSINTILVQKLGAGSGATAFKFTANAPASSLVEGESKYRLSEKVEGETPCWAWREGNTIYCYAKGFTDSNKKLPLKSAIQLFYYCSTLEEIDLHFFDTSKCTDMGAMFSDCYAVKALDVTGFNTSNVTNMSEMFFTCSALTKLDVSTWDVSKVSDMTEMFQNCGNITTIYAKDPTDWQNESKTTDSTSTNMFDACVKLKGHSAYQASSVSYKNDVSKAHTGWYFTKK